MDGSFWAEVFEYLWSVGVLERNSPPKWGALEGKEFWEVREGGSGASDDC